MRADASSSGPPLLPGLTAASVWMSPSALTTMPEPAPDVGIESGEKSVVPTVAIVTTDGPAAATRSTTFIATTLARSAAGAGASGTQTGSALHSPGRGRRGRARAVADGVQHGTSRGTTG